MQHIQILNQSTLVKTADLAPIVEALQVQVSRDFRPAYGIDAQLFLAEADNGMIPLRIVDTDADAPPDAEAWHTTDNHNRPYAIMPVTTILNDGADLAATISHELLELLADPYCYYAVDSVWPYGTRQEAWISYEVCDPVENDSYTIRTRSGHVVSVSNFVLPGWFHSQGHPLDFMNKLKTPLSLTAGGYVQVWQGGKWNDVFASHASQRRIVYGPHCRRVRRHRRHEQRHRHAKGA